MGKLIKRTGEISISDISYSSLDTTTYTNVDVVKTTVFSQAKVGTTGVDGQTRYYDKNGVELTEVAQADIDNVNSVGKYYWHTDGTLWIIVVKGTYADITAARTGLGTTSLIYQLAEPKYYDIFTTPLQAFKNGTVIQEKIIPDYGWYNDGFTITHSNYPIQRIDKLSIIDIETGIETPLDPNDAVIAGDGLSFTHPDVINGDWIDLDYEYDPSLSTNGNLSLTVACNHKAETESHSEAIKQISKTIENHDTRLKANTQSIENNESSIADLAILHLMEV